MYTHGYCEKSAGIYRCEFATKKTLLEDDRFMTNNQKIRGRTYMIHIERARKTSNVPEPSREENICDQA